MAKKTTKTPRPRNVGVQSLIERRGAGAGHHANRTQRSTQLRRKAKHGRGRNLTRTPEDA